MEDQKLVIDKLSATNYSTWKFKLKHLLIAKELFGYCDGSTEEPAGDATAAVKKAYSLNSQKALSQIVLAVSDEFIYLITECETPKEAWDKLQSHFERDTLANRIYLKKQYFRAVMKDGECVEVHLKRMKDIVNKLSAIKVTISEEDQVVTLLGSLPESYSTVVTALEAQKPETLTLTFVQNALLNEEQKRGQKVLESPSVGGGRTSASSDTALHTESNIRCFNCNQLGHRAKWCSQQLRQYSSYRGRGGRSRGRGQHNAKLVTDGNHHESTVAESNYEESAFPVGEVRDDTKNEWLIDSGASRHMSPDEAIFTSYTKFEMPEKVAIADGRLVDAVGSGNIQISVKLNRQVQRKATLYDVLHVPALKQNLFSVKSATSKGMVVQFGHSRCWIKDRSSMVHAMGTLVGKLYYIDLESSVHRANLVKSNTVWHKRLAHINHATIKRMDREQLVSGADLSSVNVDICDPCVKGKMARKTFKSRDNIKSTRPLEIVHSDVCGPMQNVSLGGSRYFVSFIDDFSRYAHVYFIDNKSDVFSVFQNFEAYVSNQTGQTIATLRTDGGGEYVSTEFEKYLQLQGIHHELSVRYLPQQNGVAERYNRTICELARALIIDADLPKSFWAEAVSTAVYVRNRVPTNAHQEATTPYQKWHHCKPDISNLRAFGSLAYSHVPDQLRQKLDDKAEVMMMVGYSLRSKAYRLFNPTTSQVVVRRDVVFDENKLGVPKLKEIESEKNSQTLTVDVPVASSDQSIVTRRSERNRFPTIRYGIDDYVNHVACLASNVIEPQSMLEAMNSPQSEQWLKAAEEEYNALIENQTWALTQLPPDRKVIGSKWVFKAKCLPDGSVDRFKARLVAQGYSQQPGIDYDETFSPVVQRSSLRTLLSYGLNRGMLIHQMDVVTAFLNGTLTEEIYIKQPNGFVSPGNEELVCKLNRSIYGLKQSPRCWNMVLDEYLKSLGFVSSGADQCVYVYDDSNAKVILAVYVDDIIILSDTEKSMQDIKQSLNKRFKMKDLGQLHFCLGINAEFNGTTLKLHQKHYVHQILEKFGMSNCNAATTPLAIDVQLVRNDGSKPVDPTLYQSIVGSLLYASTATRPDIAHSVGVLSKFNASPTETHLTAAKRVLRYLKGTLDHGITFYKSSDVSLPMIYSDANWAENDENRHSISGNVFIYNCGPISWLSKRQSTIALSTTEAEYISAFDATREAAWLRQLLADVTGHKVPPIKLYIDNQSAISIANNTNVSKRSKHMDVKFHYIRQEIQNQRIVTEYCPTDSMIADILTKPLSRNRFMTLRDMLGVS